MLKQQARLLTVISAALDITLVAVSFIAAHAYRSQFVEPPKDIFEYLWFLLFILPAWLMNLYYWGIYKSLRTKRTVEVLAQLFKAHLTAAIIASSVVFYVEPHDFGRKQFLLFILFSFLALAVGKLSLRALLYYFRRRGYNIRNILLVGYEGMADEFIRLVEHNTIWGFHIIGIIGDSTAISMQNNQYPHLGELDDIIEVCKVKMVDEVVFCLPGSKSGEIEGLVHELNEMGVTSRMILDFSYFPANRRELYMFNGELPMLTFYCNAFDTKTLLAKRILDLVGASVGLVLLTLLLPFLAFAIKLDSPGPIFFSQERVGENGRRFRCWKLRSMTVDAEERKQELMAYNEMQGQMFKMKHDPRITGVGRLLRKTSLDEIPQFWNVLKGEMSLVGTRPPTPDEVSHYENWHRKRICIKPGITGLWQVSGRSQIQDFDQVARLDIQYIENWTLWQDIKILLKTFWVVFARRGAS